MDKACENHRSNVHDDEAERYVGEDFMDLLNRLTSISGEQARERSRLLVSAVDNEAGPNGQHEKHEQKDHHCAAARAMTEMALGAK